MAKIKVKKVRGLRIGDWVRHLSSNEVGKIVDIKRKKGSRDIVPFGVMVDWKSIPKNTGVSTWQYEEDIVRIKRNP